MTPVARCSDSSSSGVTSYHSLQPEAVRVRTCTPRSSPLRAVHVTPTMEKLPASSVRMSSRTVVPSAAVGAPVAGAEGVSDDGAGARPAVASDDGAEDGAWSAGADAEGTAAALLSALPPGASPARPETVISSEGFSTVVEVTWPALFVAVTTACAVSMFSSGSEPPAGVSPARPETSSAVPAGPFGAELEDGS